MSVDKVEEQGQLFGVRARLFAASLAIATGLVTFVLAAGGAAAGSGNRFAGWGAGAAMVLALALCVSAARRVAEVVAELRSAARRMSGGDFSARIQFAGRDEFAVLGQTLDRVAGRLALTLGNLRDE